MYKNRLLYKSFTKTKLEDITRKSFKKVKKEMERSLTVATLLFNPLIKEKKL